MSLFLNEKERAAFMAYRESHTLGNDLYWALVNRVEARAENPGYHGTGRESEWWFPIAEYLTDSAMVHALKPGGKVDPWLRGATLSVVRRPVDDWVGPPFRSRATPEPMGHLETAHITWAVAVVLDLAPGLFEAGELSEIRKVLRERGIPLCRRWLDKHNHMANWRCVLAAGVTVAAVVLGDDEEIERCRKDYQRSLNIFQPDGSYAESLQYANYAAYTLMLAREALIRYDPSRAGQLPAAPWNQLPRWQAASFFYLKPLSGWGSGARPRSANFNDSAALFRPSGDLLLHLAAREQAVTPVMAGLARWLFDTLYAPGLSQGPHDLATFGFYNDYGFLAIALLPGATQAITPDEASLGEVESFSCGDVLVRDGWGGQTILAIHGGGDPLHGPGHLHGDLNSFILVHKQERLLVDPGHSCYRNLIHGLEGSSSTHNTCSFILNTEDGIGLQEDKHSERCLEQSRKARVTWDDKAQVMGPLADRGARRLIAERCGEVTVVGSDAAALYGPMIREFTRFWILCGSHALFVVDRITATKPVRTAWHWLLNNRDGGLNLKIVQPDRLVARRGAAGLKLFHQGDGKFHGLEHGYVHDVYHPHPAGQGEGKPGSGALVTFREPQAAKARTAIHAMAMDSYGMVAGWHLKPLNGLPALESPGATHCWQLEVDDPCRSIRIVEAISGKVWTMAIESDHATLKTLIK
jgi:hypothetical protein